MMEKSFPERLSALRREKNLSQRTVAAELNISQALLSHYENGAREPGLSFVCKACDYYSVSADYLLGRTEQQDPLRSLSESTTEFIDSMQQIINKARNAVKQVSIEEDET